MNLGDEGRVASSVSASVVVISVMSDFGLLPLLEKEKWLSLYGLSNFSNGIHYTCSSKN